jgi:hypothetical protein
LFEHDNFDHYAFEDIPLNRDLFLMDEVYIKEYEDAMLALFRGDEYKNVGCISYIAARKKNKDSLELSWYANVFDRFHEVVIILPRDQFIICVGCWSCEEKPRIFVKSKWLENVYLRSYSIFALIDAVDVKSALEKGGITRGKLIALRDQIDMLSQEHTDVSFISFADSLLLKSNWYVGNQESNVKHSYKPEIFIRLASDINDIYCRALGLRTYAVITQGSNEYYDDALLHISKTQNHISLNSIGIPFAQLQDIEDAARTAIKNGLHGPAELYMDELYYHSLRFKYEFDKRSWPSNNYKTKMMGTPSKYYYMSIHDVMTNLESN